MEKLGSSGMRCWKFIISFSNFFLKSLNEGEKNQSGAVVLGEGVKCPPSKSCFYYPP